MTARIHGGLRLNLPLKIFRILALEIDIADTDHADKFEANPRSWRAVTPGHQSIQYGRLTEDSGRRCFANS